MPELVRKVRETWAKEGAIAAVVKTASYPFRYFGHRAFEKRHRAFQDTISQLTTAEDRFTYIFESNHWANHESVSGFGSTLRYTERVRAQLPGLLARFNIQSMLDAPCGDFNWMEGVVSQSNVTYIGGDIVRPLIERLQAAKASDRTQFVHLDIISTPLPSADLMMCRDCLFHLSEADIFRFFENFCRSDIKYLLTTSHHNAGFSNSDIQTGDFRYLDLFQQPYRLPADTLASIEDWCEPEPKRFMHLWSREQIAKVLAVR